MAGYVRSKWLQACRALHARTRFSAFAPFRHALATQELDESAHSEQKPDLPRTLSSGTAEYDISKPAVRDTQEGDEDIVLSRVVSARPLSNAAASIQGSGSSGGGGGSSSNSSDQVMQQIKTSPCATSSGTSYMGNKEAYAAKSAGKGGLGNSRLWAAGHLGMLPAQVIQEQLSAAGLGLESLLTTTRRFQPLLQPVHTCFIVKCTYKLWHEHHMHTPRSNAPQLDRALGPSFTSSHRGSASRADQLVREVLETVGPVLGHALRHGSIADAGPAVRALAELEAAHAPHSYWNVANLSAWDIVHKLRLCVKHAAEWEADDVAGAGDAVVGLATLIMCMSKRAPIPEVTKLLHNLRCQALRLVPYVSHLRLFEMTRSLGTAQMAIKGAAEKVRHRNRQLNANTADVGSVVDEKHWHLESGMPPKMGVNMPGTSEPGLFRFWQQLLSAWHQRYLHAFSRGTMPLNIVFAGRLIQTAAAVDVYHAGLCNVVVRSIQLHIGERQADAQSVKELGAVVSTCLALASLGHPTAFYIQCIELLRHALPYQFSGRFVSTGACAIALMTHHSHASSSGNNMPSQPLVGNSCDGLHQLWLNYLLLLPSHAASFDSYAVGTALRTLVSGSGVPGFAASTKRLGCAAVIALTSRAVQILEMQPAVTGRAGHFIDSRQLRSIAASLEILDYLDPAFFAAWLSFEMRQKGLLWTPPSLLASAALAATLAARGQPLPALLIGVIRQRLPEMEVDACRRLAAALVLCSDAEHLEEAVLQRVLQLDVSEQHLVFEDVKRACSLRALKDIEHSGAFQPFVGLQACQQPSTADTSAISAAAENQTTAAAACSAQEAIPPFAAPGALLAACLAPSLRELHRVVCHTPQLTTAKQAAAGLHAAHLILSTAKAGDQQGEAITLQAVHLCELVTILSALLLDGDQSAALSLSEQQCAVAGLEALLLLLQTLPPSDMRT